MVELGGVTSSSLSAFRTFFLAGLWRRSVLLEVTMSLLLLLCLRGDRGPGEGGDGRGLTGIWVPQAPVAWWKSPGWKRAAAAAAAPAPGNPKPLAAIRAAV